MRSREILRGTRVRVSEGHRRPELRELLDTVAQKWGNSDYTALLVWLETGRYELLWDHDRDFKTAFEEWDLVKLDDREL